MNLQELQKMIEEQVQGVLPPWVAGYDKGFILPKNPTTGKLYQGYNLFVGMFLSRIKGSNLFATQRQWFAFAKKLGYFDNGSKPLLNRVDGKMPSPTTFIFAKNTEKRLRDDELANCPQEYLRERENGNFRQYVFFTTFDVLNLTDLAPGLQEKVKEHLKSEPVETVDSIESFVSQLGIEVHQGPPSYSPSRDQVSMPPMEAYSGADVYYSHLLHEIGHWSGHQSRMNRDGIVKGINFGSDPYAEEEAVAQWFSLIAQNHFGILGNVTNDAAYIQGWIKRFESDKGLLLRTFKAAESAFKHVLGLVSAEVTADETLEAIAC